MNGLFTNWPPRLPFPRFQQTAGESVPPAKAPRGWKGCFLSRTFVQDSGGTFSSLLGAEAHTSSADSPSIQGTRTLQVSGCSRGSPLPHPLHRRLPWQGFCWLLRPVGPQPRFSLLIHSQDLTTCTPCDLSLSDAGAPFPNPCFDLCPLHRPISTRQPQ